MRCKSSDFATGPTLFSIYNCSLLPKKVRRSLRSMADPKLSIKSRLENPPLLQYSDKNLSSKENGTNLRFMSTKNGLCALACLSIGHLNVFSLLATQKHIPTRNFAGRIQINMRRAVISCIPYTCITSEENELFFAFEVACKEHNATDVFTMDTKRYRWPSCGFVLCGHVAMDSRLSRWGRRYAAISVVSYDTVLHRLELLERFQLTIEGKLRLFWFCITSLCDWPVQLTPRFQPMRSKTNTNRNLHGRIFPRFASYSDWSIALFVSVVIGQSNCFCLGFTTLSLLNLCN